MQAWKYFFFLIFLPLTIVCCSCKIFVHRFKKSNKHNFFSIRKVLFYFFIFVCARVVVVSWHIKIRREKRRKGFVDLRLWKEAYKLWEVFSSAKNDFACPRQQFKNHMNHICILYLWLWRLQTRVLESD